VGNGACAKDFPDNEGGDLSDQFIGEYGPVGMDRLLGYGWPTNLAAGTSSPQEQEWDLNTLLHEWSRFLPPLLLVHAQ